MVAGRKISTTFLIIFAFLIVGCAGPHKIRVTETYQTIKPLAPLPQHLIKKQSYNLIVKINNVADLSKSYKNKVDLFINNYLVEPEVEPTNVKRNYLYKLRLQPGIYEVYAKYYASTGWEEKTFKITTKENVMIFPDKVAKLTIRLKKNAWGGLLDKVTYFDVDYSKISPK